MQLSEYSLGRLRGDGEFTLYEAHAKQIEPTFVLQPAPDSTRPSTETLEKIDHECSVRSELNPDWAVRPLAFSERGARITLTLEDPGGKTLDGHLEAMDIKHFWREAVGFTTTLEALYERELIRKSVKPTNVLAHSPTDQAGLDFGPLPAFGVSRRAPEAPGFIAGTVPDMAPERIGRKNRSIDSRNDVYALDGTLYQMLNGNLPFTASDPVEWAHCDITRQPVPPHDRAKSVPAGVFAIVMKLDAKAPEKCYQTTVGVESDLRRRVAKWEPHKFIADASPAHDAADCLLILERLYGRARELAIPLIAVNRVLGGGRDLVLVSGYSGIGESAIVNESPKPLVPEFFAAAGPAQVFWPGRPWAS